MELSTSFPCLKLVHIILLYFRVMLDTHSTQVYVKSDHLLEGRGTEKLDLSSLQAVKNRLFYSMYRDVNPLSTSLKVINSG